MTNKTSDNSDYYVQTDPNQLKLVRLMNSDKD